MTKVYDPKLLGTNEDLENPNPYLQNFERCVTLFAQSKNISKEEALSEAIQEFSKLEDPKEIEEIKRNLESSIKQSVEFDLENEQNKEKYPYLHLLHKLNDQMCESLNIPKLALCKFNINLQMFQILLRNKQLSLQVSRFLIKDLSLLDLFEIIIDLIG